MEEQIAVNVLVPASRLAAFYKAHAEWLEAAAKGQVIAAQSHDQLVEAATRWLKSLRRGELAIWDMWIDAAPALVSASEIVDRLSLKGVSSIPGYLRWSQDKGRKAGFPVWWNFRSGADSGGAAYGLSGSPAAGLSEIGVSATEYVEILREAREVLR